MTKKEFLKKLAMELSGLSAADTKNSLEYYSEMIDERIDSGIGEEAACADLGTPQKIAREIMMNMSMSKVIKSKLKRRRALKIWEIVCLILGSPIWLSLIICAFAIALSLYIALWSVYISIAAVDIALVLGGGALSFASLFRLAENPANAVLCIGIGLCGIGIGAFCLLPCFKLGKGFVKLSIKLTKFIKSIIVGRNKK